MSKTKLLEKPKSKVGRNDKGQWVKGHPNSNNGKNGFTAIKELTEALKRRGIEQQEGFWDMVAKKAWESDQILIAILKKLIPDRQTLEHELPDHFLEKFRGLDAESLQNKARELAFRITGSPGRN